MQMRTPGEQLVCFKSQHSNIVFQLLKESHEISQHQIEVHVKSIER